MTNTVAQSNVSQDRAKAQAQVEGVEKTIGPGTEKVEGSTLAYGHMLMPWIMWSLVSREPLRLPFAVFRSCRLAESGTFGCRCCWQSVPCVTRTQMCKERVGAGVSTCVGQNRRSKSRPPLVRFTQSCALNGRSSFFWEGQGCLLPLDRAGPVLKSAPAERAGYVSSFFASLKTRMLGHCLLCQFFCAGSWWMSTRRAVRGTLISPWGLFQRALDCAQSERRRQLLEHIFCAGGQCLRFGSRAQKIPRPYVLFKQVPFFARRVCITLAIFFHVCMLPTRKPSDPTCSSNSLALVCLGAKCLQVSHPHHLSSCSSFRFCAHLASCGTTCTHPHVGTFSCRRTGQM